MLCITKDDHVILVPNHPHLEKHFGKEVNISLDKKGDINECTIEQKIDGMSKQQNALIPPITLTKEKNSKKLGFEKSHDISTRTFEANEREI